MKPSTLLSGAAFSSLSLAQQTAYGQCGGGSWSGETSCVAGYTCSAQNQYYAQCTPGSAAAKAPSTLVTTTTAKSATTTARATTTATAKSSSTSATATAATTGKFKWLGVDESGAEFGQGNIPGVYGTDFTFPSNTSIDTLIGEGFNIFRVPFLMERMIPTALIDSPNAAYLANYTGTINHITSKGAYAVIDPHNYGRYYGNVIIDTAGFQAFWTTLAGAFKSNTKVIFDTNNEYHDEDQTNVLNMNQAAINGIRAAGATSQYIFVEGNSYTGAWTWNTTNDNLKALTDTQNKIIYEMHQYLDSDGSGTSATCVSTDIGVQRVEGATAWLRANGKLGVLGEYAGGANSICMTAITGMLNHMQANSDVWLGALWWGGGPWWGDYIYSFESPSGTCYSYYLTTLEGYKPLVAKTSQIGR